MLLLKSQYIMIYALSLSDKLVRKSLLIIGYNCTAKIKTKVNFDIKGACLKYKSKISETSIATVIKGLCYDYKKYSVH